MFFFKVNPNIKFEVFIHKVDGLTDDHKIGIVCDSMLVKFNCDILTVIIPVNRIPNFYTIFNALNGFFRIILQSILGLH